MLILFAWFEHGERDVRVFTSDRDAPVTSREADSFSRRALGTGLGFSSPFATGNRQTDACGLIIAWGTEGEVLRTHVHLDLHTRRETILVQGGQVAAQINCADLQKEIARLRAVSPSVTPPLQVHLAEGKAFLRGCAVPLTNREFDLLAALSLASRPFSTDMLLDKIWPEADPAGARNALKVYVHRLRRRLGHAAVIQEGNAWRLSETVAVDTREWRSYLRDRSQLPLDEAARVKLRDAFETLSRGTPAIAQRSPLWSEIEEELQSALRSIGGRLVEDALARRDPVCAIAIARALLPIDPYAEAWHGAIMRGHLQLENIAAARNQLLQYSSVLDSDLGVAPGPNVLELAMKLTA